MTYISAKTLVHRYLKENVLRGRCQDANVKVNLAFDYQSKCILSKFKH